MAHLLADSSSNCSSSVAEQIQEDGTFTDNAFDMDIPMDQYSVSNPPTESSGAVFEDVNFDQSKFIGTFPFTDFPDLGLTDLTGLPDAPCPIESQVAAPYLQDHLQRATYPLPPQRSVPALQRRALIPITGSPLRPQPPRYTYPSSRISQAQHNWNLLQSALGVIPCTRRLPASTNPSFLWRPIPDPQPMSSDSNQCVMDFPNHPPRTQPLSSQLSGRQIRHSYPNHLHGETLLRVVNDPPRWNAEMVWNHCPTDGRHASSARPYMYFRHRMHAAEEETAVRQEVDALHPGKDGDARHKRLRY